MSDAEAMIRSLRESRERDTRFRMLTDSVTHQALNEFLPTANLNTREASDLALLVATLMLQRIYDEDAELRALRHERDHYKARALSMANLIPGPLVILKGDARWNNVADPFRYETAEEIAASDPLAQPSHPRAREDDSAAE